jgi:transcriptional regulator with XRE-family HTH domain
LTSRYRQHETVPAETKIIQLLRQRIRRIRLEQGISQDVFAERLGTSVRYIQLIEGTGHFNPSVSTLMRLAKTLKTDFFVLTQAPSNDELMLLENPPKSERAKRKAKT